MRRSFLKVNTLRQSHIRDRTLKYEVSTIKTSPGEALCHLRLIYECCICIVNLEKIDYIFKLMPISVIPYLDLFA